MTKKQTTKNRNNYLPSYIRIKSDIINRITNGELQLNDKLPTETELCDHYKAGRNTVRDALRELADAGIIRRIHGSGSYIERDNVEEDYEDIFSHITQSPKVTISFGVLNPAPEYEMLLKTMAGIFSIENPGSKVKIIKIHSSDDRFGDPYLSRISANNLPTVGEFFMYANYAKLDALMPMEQLPEFERLENSVIPQCLYPTVNSSGDQHIHAIAIKLNARILMINADLALEAGLDPANPPVNWNELEQWAEVLGEFTKKSKPGCYGIFSGIPSGWHCVIGNLPYLRDGSIPYKNSLDGLIEMIQAPRCLTGLKFLHKINQVGNPVPGDDGMQQFALGRVGIFITGAISAMAINLNSFDQFTLKTVEIPTPATNLPEKSVMGNFSLGIFRSAVNNDTELKVAWDWIRFLFRKKHQYLLSANLTIPALKNIPSPVQKYSPEINQVLTTAIESSIPQFDFAGVREALACFGTEMRHAIHGKITPEQCISNSIANLKKLKSRPTNEHNRLCRNF
jgi:ABC-type glycerol-3-phosphate transport system substrate-binding protein